VLFLPLLLNVFAKRYYLNQGHTFGACWSAEYACGHKCILHVEWAYIRTCVEIPYLGAQQTPIKALEGVWISDWLMFYSKHVPRTPFVSFLDPSPNAVRMRVLGEFNQCFRLRIRYMRTRTVGNCRLSRHSLYSRYMGSPCLSPAALMAFALLVLLPWLLHATVRPAYMFGILSWARFRPSALELPFRDLVITHWIYHRAVFLSEHLSFQNFIFV
jgi:hypothetical protein